jgi:putative hydrolase of HD superfamily
MLCKASLMPPEEALRILHFLREAERLKNVYRSAWTSDGRPESTAEHSWRLCLLALVIGRYWPGLDMGKLLKLCIIHDLGEAISGDIPAIYQSASAPKAEQERRDLLQLLAPLPEPIQQEITALWDEYEAAASPEAQAAKALDKLETLLQHNQGANPPDFDYVFNLEYGKRFTDALPLTAGLRALIDLDTKARAAASNGYTEP